MVRRQGFRHFYGGNLAIVVVQFCMRILHTDVIGSPTAHSVQNHSPITGFHLMTGCFIGATAKSLES